MRKFEDTYRHKGLRKKLIGSLRDKGITSEKVLDAMNEVPRHFFLDTALDNIAYEDRAFPIAVGQTISQPYTVAYQTSLLEVQPQEQVLLPELGPRVYDMGKLAGKGAGGLTALYLNMKSGSVIEKKETIDFTKGVTNIWDAKVNVVKKKKPGF